MRRLRDSKLLSGLTGEPVAFSFGQLARRGGFLLVLLYLLNNNMFALLSLLLLLGLSKSIFALRFDQKFIDYNLNENQQAVNPLDYSGKWQDHKFFPSPDNWRFPIYTLFLDRFVNGDATNDDINGTQFEHDIL